MRDPAESTQTVTAMEAQLLPVFVIHYNDNRVSVMNIHEHSTGAFNSLPFTKKETSLHTTMPSEEEVLCWGEFTNEFPSLAHQVPQIPCGI